MDINGTGLQIRCTHPLSQYSTTVHELGIDGSTKSNDLTTTTLGPGPKCAHRAGAYEPLKPLLERSLQLAINPPTHGKLVTTGRPQTDRQTVVTLICG